MQSEHKEAFVEVLNSMKQYWGQPPLSEYASDVYWNYLKKFSLKQFRAASEKLLESYKVRWPGDFPIPLDFYEATPNDPTLV